MKDAQPKPTRREDYRPPDFWIDEVELEVDLGEEVTRVVARLQVRRNLAVAKADALRLNGERLRLIELAIDGAIAAPSSYEIEPELL
ncbi:MAG: hypothetical protein IAG13_26820, partial [Deltaproteobacteria bacterium]|nr:hypothetical protein [Nannocystaceae bacterium]